MADAKRNKALVSEAFAAWTEGDGNAFFRLLADDVVWTVIGSTEISGTFHSRQAFLEGAARKLGARLATPIAPTVVGLIAEGDWVSLQWQGRATADSGIDYDQRYAWVVRFAGERIVEGTAYLDTALVARVMAG